MSRLGFEWSIAFLFFGCVLFDQCKTCIAVVLKSCRGVCPLPADTDGYPRVMVAFEFHMVVGHGVRPTTGLERGLCEAYVAMMTGN